MGIDVEFSTLPRASIRNVCGVRVQSSDGEDRFPIMKAGELPDGWRKEISKMRSEIRALQREAGG